VIVGNITLVHLNIPSANSFREVETHIVIPLKPE
jgi:hypothetical protein